MFTYCGGMRSDLQWLRSQLPISVVSVTDIAAVIGLLKIIGLIACGSTARVVSLTVRAYPTDFISGRV